MQNYIQCALGVHQSYAEEQSRRNMCLSYWNADSVQGKMQIMTSPVLVPQLNIVKMEWFTWRDS